MRGKNSLLEEGRRITLFLTAFTMILSILALLRRPAWSLTKEGGEVDPSCEKAAGVSESPPFTNPLGAFAYVKVSGGRRKRKMKCCFFRRMLLVEERKPMFESNGHEKRTGRGTAWKGVCLLWGRAASGGIGDLLAWNSAPQVRGENWNGGATICKGKSRSGEG